MAISGNKRIKEIWMEQSRETGEPIICALCLNPISPSGDRGRGNLSADHIIPRSLGGDNTQANKQPAHSKCNHRRSDMTMEEVAANRHIFTNPVGILPGQKARKTFNKHLEYIATHKGLKGKERKEYIKRKREEFRNGEK